MPGPTITIGALGSFGSLKLLCRTQTCRRARTASFAAMESLPCTHFAALGGLASLAKHCMSQVAILTANVAVETQWKCIQQIFKDERTDIAKLRVLRINKISLQDTGSTQAHRHARADLAALEEVRADAGVRAPGGRDVVHHRARNVHAVRVRQGRGRDGVEARLQLPAHRAEECACAPRARA